MLRWCATASSGFCASISSSSLAASGIVLSVKPLSISMTISAGRSPKPILMPKPRSLKKSSSALPLVMLEPFSVPPPHAVGMAVLHLWRHVVRLAVADGAEQSDPVQQFAADVAGLQHLMLRRLLDEGVDLLAFQELDDARAPIRVRHAVGAARRHAGCAALQ